mgnify:CR=1 FL=1
MILIHIIPIPSILLTKECFSGFGEHEWGVSIVGETPLAQGAWCDVEAAKQTVIECGYARDSL